MQSVAIFLLLFAAPLTSCLDPKKKKETYDALEVANRSAVEIVQLRGYDYEVHYATTPDGYKIHLVHLINPLVPRSDESTIDLVRLKRPVIFNHGLLESSSIWLINSHNVRPTFNELCAREPLDIESVRTRNDSINGPMMLANEGYDVWLMSMRGTDVSRGHLTLSDKDPKYWDYSLDEFALGDIPTVVDYVREHTGAPKVAYVGHSQATFSIFGLLATIPEYADIIEPVFAVAPVAYMHRTNSIARALFLSALRVRAANGPFPQHAKKMREKIEQTCLSKTLLKIQFACKLLDVLIGGPGRGILPGYFSHVPFSTSLKVLRHFGQIIKKKNFTHYDHGPEENFVRYGSWEAPNYNIGKIRSRSLCLISTETDALSRSEDVNLFKQHLKVPLLRDISIGGNFNHFDLITNEDARYLVFGHILQLLEQFERADSGGTCATGASQEHRP